jgi:tRNA 2-selenouridine synthase SelU
MTKSKINHRSTLFREVPSTREEIKNIISQKSIPSLYWILTGKAGSGKSFLMEELGSQDFFPLHSSRLADKNICTQLLFEALLAKELFQNPIRFLVEDKGRKIAHLSIPEKLLQAWNKAPHFYVDTPLEERVENIFNAHIGKQQEDYNQLSFLERNKERMGDTLYQKLHQICKEATHENDPELHKEWIRTLVIEHLDPIFDYYFHHKKPAVIYKAKKSEVLKYLKIESEKLKTIALNREALGNLESKL